MAPLVIEHTVLIAAADNHIKLWVFFHCLFVPRAACWEPELNAQLARIQYC